MDVRDYVIAGPGTRRRVILGASQIKVSNCGALEIYVGDVLTQAISGGQWDTFWIDEEKGEKK